MTDLGALSGPVLLFGGPYGNIQATLAMRSEAARLQIPPSNVICNGDLVAYCADPEDTVNLIRDWEIRVVMGNCEESISQNSDDCGCGFEPDTTCSLLSREWYDYSRERVSAGNRDWMRALPRQLRFTIGDTRFAVVHGSPTNISAFVFDSTDPVTKNRLVRDLDVDCVICGHAGIPFGNRTCSTEPCTSDETPRFWLNTGVIGMPANDGTQDGWYLVIDDVSGNLECRWNRLAFDYAGAARSMEQAGLSAAYRNALLSGHWPSLDVLPETEKRQRGQAISLTPLRLN